MKKELIDAVMDRTNADFVIKNGFVADVFTGRFMPCDILVKNGKICGVGEYDCDNVVDATGKYVLPGFIDSHVHIESSMVTPPQYAKTVMARGVTTVIADPHEIANVCGKDGLDFMKSSSENLPLDIFYMMPSCVPSTPFENTGAVFTAEDTKTLSDNFFGIGEMMNYPGVINGDDETLNKLVKEKIDGHAPELSGRKLDAYVCAGIKTDHECSTVSEMLEKIGKGMTIALREGTLSKDLSRLVYGINHHTQRSCIFCTDDRFVGEIIEQGSIDYTIKKSVELGVHPLTAISVGTINAARCYGLTDRGAIAPGYNADLVIVNNPHEFKVETVFKNGIKVAEGGKALFDTVQCPVSKVIDTVCLENVTPEFFKHEPGEEFDAVMLTPNAITTKKVKAKKGDKTAKVCVIERHHNTGNKGFGYVTNYGITNGAIALSIGHDSHNVLVIGDNDNDMAMAVNTLGKSGGISVVSNGELKGYLELEIGGIMTNKEADYVTKIHDELTQSAYDLGVTKDVDPFLSLAFLPLPVIPEIRITDKGLFDVKQFKFI